MRISICELRMGEGWIGFIRKSQIGIRNSHPLLIAARVGADRAVTRGHVSLRRVEMGGNAGEEFDSRFDPPRDPTAAAFHPDDFCRNHLPAIGQ